MIQCTRHSEKLLKNLKKFNAETYYHSLRIKNLTLQMIHHMQRQTMETLYTDGEITAICKGAVFHDIGRLFIKNCVLTKRGALSGEEYEAMAAHTVKGYEVLKDDLDPSESQIVLNICLYHHHKISADEDEENPSLPLYVQIVSICDVFDALRHDRIYRAAICREEALDMIERGDCGTFSPKLVECLRAVTSQTNRDDYM